MITIKVTEKDIQNGKRRDCNGCPLALAIRRAYAKFDKKVLVRVGLNDVEITINGKSSGWVAMPVICRVWVRVFDHHDDVQPFTFELPEPEHLVV